MIKIDSLYKFYGEIKAVNGISLEIKQGEITGFLGPNGAGKSSTLKILAGFNKPNSGTISINQLDFDTHPETLKKQIGYLPELNPLYSEMSVYEYLQFIARIRGIKDEDFEEKLQKTAQQCGLTERLSQVISTLSKGFKQRVGLAQAIIHNPPVLILDEPTNGLDPNQIVEIRSLIRELGKDKTVILSSHILQEVQAICDRIVIIHQGIIVADSPKDELLKGLENRQSVDIEFTKINFDKKAFLNRFPGMKINLYEESENSIRLSCEIRQKDDIRISLSKYLTGLNATVIELKHKLYSLEEIFHLLTHENIHPESLQEVKK